MSDVELSEALKNKEELFSYIQSSVQTVGLDGIFIKSKKNVHDNAMMLRENKEFPSVEQLSLAKVQ